MKVIKKSLFLKKPNKSIIMLKKLSILIITLAMLLSCADEMLNALLEKGALSY